VKERFGTHPVACPLSIGDCDKVSECGKSQDTVSLQMMVVKKKMRGLERIPLFASSQGETILGLPVARVIPHYRQHSPAVCTMLYCYVNHIAEHS